MLGLHHGSVVPADTLVELLWGQDPPRTAAKALQTHISSLRRTLGDGFVVTQGAGWALAEGDVDASRYKSAARLGRDAAAAGDINQALARFDEALALWRGIPELPDGRRGTPEKTRWIEGHAALIEERADALLATGRAAEIIGDLEAAVAEAPLRERRWGQLMLALYRAGRQGEALGAYQRARSLLADDLGVDPGPELRRLQAAIVTQDASLDIAVAQNVPSVTRAVTFLLTDIEGSTAAWEADADAMAVALARHDELVEQVVTSRGGRLIKTRGEGDATFSVFDRPSAGAAAAIELQDAIAREPWTSREPIRVRMALHTGEVEFRDGDYFGRAVNRVARLRSLAEGGQILCSGATAELVIDSLADDVMLTDLGMRQLKNLARPEHVFELRLETGADVLEPQPPEAPMERPAFPAVLVGPGPFVGRGRELEGLLSAWQNALAGGVRTVLIAGEPGVGKTRLSGEWSKQAYAQGAIVLYGRCDEDLGAPYQPFAEALRSLVPCVGADRLRGLRGVEALLSLVPGLADVVPDLTSPPHADPDTERYALFDAVVALLEIASKNTPIVLILDDLHWAAKPTLLLLRHLLRFGDHARVQIVGTYRSTDLDRSHPLAAMLADLHRDGTANRLTLGGLDEDDVTAYVAEAGYDDEELAHALASVTGGNPFFLIEALRHVDESGGVWDQSTLPQGVREAVSRRLTRLPAETNKALAAAAVVGSRFALELVEQVVGSDLVDAFDEARQAGIVIEEPGGYYRFNHAIVRQSLLAELASVRRMRLHQRIAATLETLPGADDELLAELAHHYFECAWAGNAAKAVLYCRRAADQAMTRLAYEGAADLYNRALHALEEIDDELPDRDEQTAELLVARCEALLAAGDVASATGAVSQLHSATVDSARLSAWATCFDGQLSMLIHPERLDEVEAALGAAAAKLAELDDPAGEATAHTVRAGCLARLGRIGDCEVALDDALTAARRAREHRRVNAVLAGAPLAALWGPNPVPRAGGRCLDVVRLLRITTDSPAVEATSTRCQAVLEAFRGRAAAARRMIDSARRTVTELGLRHALLEVDQFAGIVELIVDDAAAAEPHLRKAYNGFRRMGLDADAAETAALLGRGCLALGRDDEARELCAESERLAGHALKASIAWRTLRAHLLARGNDYDAARRVAQEAVTLAERTDALVDHGDACLTLAAVLGVAGDTAGARAAAEQAVDLYERKGATALAEMARLVLGERVPPPAAAPTETPAVQLDNACVRVGDRVMAAVDREAWDEFEGLFATNGVIESRRKIVGFSRNEYQLSGVMHQTRLDLESGAMRVDRAIVAVRGQRLALARMTLRSADTSPGAPLDELLQLSAIDDDGRVALQIWFDIDDIDAAIAELDATQARLEEKDSQARRLDNAATHVYECFWSHFAARDWDAVKAILSQSLSGADHRRVVNAGNRGSPATVIEDLQVAADLGFTIWMADVVAIRGERLALTRVRASGRDPETIQNDAFNLVEIDADENLTSIVVFDLDDIDGAVGELDRRYLAGEAAAHARTWSAVAGTFSSIRKHEFPTLAGDCVSVDHRRASAFAPGDLAHYIRAGGDINQSIRPYVEVVHRLSDFGAVCTYAEQGGSDEGFDAEWHEIAVTTVEGDMVNRCELYDDADLDAAIARFDQLSGPAPRLENRAARVFEHVWSHFAAGDWDTMAQTVADNYVGIDHRRVVSAETQHDRHDVIRDLQAAANVGFTISMVSAIAIRGERLVLARVRACGRDPEAIQNDALNVVEIDADDRIAHVVSYDLEDTDAAIAELDAQYIAFDAAAYAHTWSVVTAVYDDFNRREHSATTPDWVSIDNRHGAGFAPGDMIAYIDAAWDDSPDTKIHIAAVHRLSGVGAVVTHVAHGISRQGFDAEWRDTHVLIVKGGMLSHSELFDHTDVDAAIARFDQLSRPEARLENAASQVYERVNAYFTTRDWDALADALAQNMVNDDRRRMVNSGIRRGRDVEIANGRVFVELGGQEITSTVAATRGDRLALCRSSIVGQGRQSGPFRIEFLSVVEIDADKRLKTHIAFDLDDFATAVAELDARYLAGEAAPHSETWSAVAESYAALNRHEQPLTTPDCVNVDHRREAAFGPGDMNAYLQAGWDAEQDINVYVKQVHRLSGIGAVVTYSADETSHGGLEAEWGGIAVFAVGDDMINRTEVFNESDIDAAIARFDELSRPVARLENAASQVVERFTAYYAAGDWQAMAHVLADNYSSDDRRRLVGSGVRHGRDAHLADMRARAELWRNRTSTVIATRGERLALTRIGLASLDQGREGFVTEVPIVHEINADGRLAAGVAFNLDDLDAAIAELDARYLAGEAAAYAHTWSAITQAYAALNRGREHPATTPDWVNIDHRRGIAFEPGAGSALLDNWHAMSDLNNTCAIETVHRLNNVGALVTSVTRETSPEGFQAEWRVISLLTVRGDLIDRLEVYEEADLERATARFEQLTRPAPRLENAASRADERFSTYFAEHDWDAMAELMADTISIDDRRHVVNIGLRQGRGVEIANLRARADIGVERITSTVVATRGDYLALTRTRFSGHNQQAEEFDTEALCIVEIDADQRIAARVGFDLDDFVAAIAELDARYLAGEAAAYSHSWSTVVETYAAVNSKQLRLTPDCVNIDHRRARAFEPGELTAYMHATWEIAPNVRGYIEAVHRLDKLGAVVTHVVRGSSQEGFNAEWRELILAGFEGDLLNRCELFDEADLDAALAKFDQLYRAAARLENAASQAGERLYAYYSSRDWDAMAEILADDTVVDDRRRMVNFGHWHGRDVVVANHRAIAKAGTNITSTVLAIRGSRLALLRGRNHDLQGQEFDVDFLTIVETNADSQIATHIAFEIDDADAALEELENLYLAGEPAAYASAWSTLLRGFAAFNNHELPSTTPDWVNLDHRRGRAFSPGELVPYIHATWQLTPQAKIYVCAVHRLSDLGAVVSQSTHGTSTDGFDAEWREVTLLTLDGDLINRIEVFDEADLDAALARFEELQSRARRLENAASKVVERFWACLASRDWAAMADTMASDFTSHDHRRVVNAGVLRGRDANMANMRAVAEVGFEALTSAAIATRGQRLALSRIRGSVHGFEAGETSADMLGMFEIDADNRFTAGAIFDSDDIDIAFAELDRRYLAGEAAAFAQTWSVVAGVYDALNRHELPATTPAWANIDHRRLASIGRGDLTAYVRAAWRDTPDINIYVEAVHRLSDRGVVITYAAHGTSQEGFDAEWRDIGILTVDGDLLDRCEVFDEADLEVALARFEELHPQAHRSENVASQAIERFSLHFTACDWHAMTQLLVPDVYIDDRRRGANAGIRHGRDAAINDMRTSAGVGFTTATSALTATRGNRLALARIHMSARSARTEEFWTDSLHVVEVDANGQTVAVVVFDLDDIDAAFEELDARYLAGEAAAHANTWSVITRECTAFNQHKLSLGDRVTIDHRRLAVIDASDPHAAVRGIWDVTPDFSIYIEAVHRFSSVGAVATYAAHGTSPEGFNAEWRIIELVTVEDDRINRYELFDEADLVAALARFDELQPEERQLGNTATHIYERLLACHAACDWPAMTEIVSDDLYSDDRRPVVGAGLRHGRDALVEDLRAVAAVEVTDATAVAIATRGMCIALTRARYSRSHEESDEFYVDYLQLVEVDADSRITALIAFGPDDIGAALAELDARYLAGEAAAHAHTWSVVTSGYSATNRHELSGMTPDSVYIDHRVCLTTEPEDLAAYLPSVWDLTPDISSHIAAVHQLSDRGAVISHVACGTTQEGLDAEWRAILIVMVEGDLLSRVEVFDDTDLDAALACFDELHSPPIQLENAASRVFERYLAHYVARNWNAVSEMLADDILNDDRRRVVNAGVLHRRDATMASMQAVAAFGLSAIRPIVIATRGERLSLTREHWLVGDQQSGTFSAELLGIVEIDADERIVARVVFDADDIDAAFGELDARYLAGEAAGYSGTWSVIAEVPARFNRRELPATTSNPAYIDHRPLVSIEGADLAASIRAVWDITSDSGAYIEAVHQMNERGAVFTEVLNMTSQDGFEAEMRMIMMFTVEGGLIARVEVFDEPDLDGALARFEELTGEDQPK
ncbi:BTAD domain-containing putative transcriptional regulator [Mycobacterium sp. 94-17]|uniref:BTAD domain-containing putative transcriptional regulator n=1 Tax=Mycobacterium sp. 94-17 TaxID=2986147 RepID=UPI002D1F3541|nr:BTAD domain-containing putative transcriptional regulator [Mycobacterium sp. 94-17]MEB4211376.1 BTAD domain-containing putative transcriptional regulator [Mycobacterium sp. 94-17]